MKWDNLKKNRCPQCNGDLATSTRVETTTGSGLKHKCGFTISDRKFEQIVSERINKDLLYPDAEVQTEDFL